MFSYRHLFHIGNFADVLKHSTLIACIKHMSIKEKPFIVVDTHAGAGKYSITDPIGRDKMEWELGLGKILKIKDQKRNLPPMMQDYLDLVIQFNNGDKFRFIPGSPALTLMLLRKKDKLWAFELHPSDFKNLKKNFSEYKKKIVIEKSDGFQSFRKLFPPISRRGLILIDPSYENKTDYQKTIFYLKEGIRKFATGIFILWLPCTQRYEVNKTIKKIHSLNIKNVFHLSLNLRYSKGNSLGLSGSNLIIVNPPFGIEKKLKKVASFMEQNFTAP